MNLIDVNVASYLEMLIYLLLIAEEANFKKAEKAPTVRCL